MSVPEVRVNSFLQRNVKPVTDALSKVFFICQMAVGLNRLPVMGDIRLIYIVLTVIYALVVNIVVNYMLYIEEKQDLIEIMIRLKTIQYTLCCIVGFILCKRLQRYYTILNKFDDEFRGTIKLLTNEVIAIILHMCIVSVLIMGLFIQSSEYFHIPLHLVYITENHYYGYLLNHLHQRLLLINDHVGSSVSVMNAKFLNTAKVVDIIYHNSKSSKKYNMPMSKVMTLYQILIDAHDALTDAIKWQFLIILTTSFCFLLIQSLHIAKLFGVMDKEEMSPMRGTLPYLGLMSTEMLSLFSPCLCSDQVRAQVRRLRELLASTLYENKLDKSSRGVTRALLSLIETRDLSFCLLRVVNISVSLPFTFVGLLVTYLIIMLQFETISGRDGNKTVNYTA